MLDICLMGVGGTVPMPGRPLTALLARCAGKCLLIDCGEGTQVSIRAAGKSLMAVDMILLTHLHGDHILGLPGMLLSMARDGRTKPVELIGPTGAIQAARCLCGVIPNLPFPLSCREISGEAAEFSLGAMRVQAFSMAHGVPCYGYRINVDRAGRFMPEKARALGADVRDFGRLQRGEAIRLPGGMCTPDMVMGPPRRGIRVAYCTDTRPCQGLSRCAEGADLLICEGMYGDPEKLPKALQNGHMMVEEAAEAARAAGAGEMWLTHFSPSMDSPKSYLLAAREIFENTVVPEPPRCANLNFDSRGAEIPS